jgi:hypothetical protein
MNLIAYRRLNTIMTRTGSHPNDKKEQSDNLLVVHNKPVQRFGTGRRRFWHVPEEVIGLGAKRVLIC